MIQQHLHQHRVGCFAIVDRVDAVLHPHRRHPERVNDPHVGAGGENRLGSLIEEQDQVVVLPSCVVGQCPAPAYSESDDSIRGLFLHANGDRFEGGFINNQVKWKGAD